MKPTQAFLQQPREFWAAVRLVSAILGYKSRTTGQIQAHSTSKITDVLRRVGRAREDVEDTSRTLADYFSYRADILLKQIEPRLMTEEQARLHFDNLRRKLSPTSPLPMNSQRLSRKAPAYLASIVNMLVEAHSQGFPCEYEPRLPITLARNGIVLDVLTNRVNGAFTSSVNPVAIWQVREFYYSNVRGNHLAEAFHETLLIGMEVAHRSEQHVSAPKHYLIVDGYDSWWRLGLPYLGRMVDLLHMRYVDEVLFGNEVIEQLPALVREWTEAARSRIPE
ncbi:MAG TPA: hypothetical protein VF914_04775 [Chloroflexia bacterium]|jgi:hypothetical protein